ncbi:hypothetical protein [Halobellus sp. Atlit-38R]|uniref:hypothetical protein n=1 Tax=Halobellus sp. Atlit-38R TaxID=2282131 RepID=UPI0011C42B59|nr:hypothetical protein [Halobellus sp. Atlit-38R]
MAFELLAQRAQNPVTLLNGFLRRLPTAIRPLWLAAELTIDGRLLTSVIIFARVGHADAGGRAVYVS